MKKLLLLFSVFFVFTTSFNVNDNVIIKHTNYTTTFSKSKKYPVIVEWWTTTKMVNCNSPLKRKDNFKPDPKLPGETDLSKDYLKSGYDRGHMMPAADNLCQTQEVQDECFYFSNMSPQTHSLNAGDWKSLETETRKLALEKDSIHVWAGNIGEIKKIGRVSVPKTCWKVIHIKKTNEWMSFIFENNTSKPDGYQNNRVDLTIVENLTGLKFR